MGIKKIIKRFIPEKILARRRSRIQSKRTERAKLRMQEVTEAASAYGVNTSARDRKLIVSLTSYPARFESVQYAIRSILTQTVRPDRIILYLDDTVKPEQIPAELEALERVGLEIAFRPLTLKPHKKYYYAMKENPDALIVTVDDDQIYPPDLLEKLCEGHEQFPQCVIAARAHEITFCADGKIKSYNTWKMHSKKVGKPSMLLCATGVGGVLYPPHCMHGELLRCDLISTLSPSADDLWLKVMQVLQGTKVVVCDKTLWGRTFEVTDSQETALNYENVGNNQNDIQMENLIRHYRLTKRDFLQ